MDKGNVVHTYNGLLLSHKKDKIGSFVGMWIDPETFTQSEAEREQILYVNEYMWNTENGIDAGIDDPVCKAKIETQIQRKNVWTARRERQGMNWETGVDVYTLLMLGIKKLMKTHSVAHTWSPK